MLMKIIDLKKMAQVSMTDKVCCALGNFDGIHLGHKAVFDMCLAYAKANNLKSMVYTFCDSYKKYGKNIFTTEEKIEAIRNEKFDYICLDNLSDVKDYSGLEFVKKILVEKLNVEYACCGFNFSFGINASCNSEDLKNYLSKFGKNTGICSEYSVNNTTLSSSFIKELIIKGDMESVSKYSYDYSISSDVIHGKNNGTSIGFPTINQLVPDSKIAPKNGVYVSKTIIDSKWFPSVTNVGFRPTVETSQSFLNVETHIIGYSGNLYGKSVKVSFLKWLRDEIRFDNLEQLRMQISSDKESAMRYFEKHRV